MKADDYHRWWLASGIGLGHPLNEANSNEMKKHLSEAGRCIATLLHTIPAQESTVSRNYFIGNTEAARALRWAETAEAVGATKLAESLREEARHDFDPDKTSMFEPLRNYPNVESHEELRALISTYAEAHGRALAADVEKHGDRRSEFPADPKSFHKAWLRLVDKKHDEQRAVEDAERRAKEGEVLLAKVSKLEKLLTKSVMPHVADQLIDELSDTWDSWHLTHDLTFSSAAGEWLSRLGKLISSHPVRFPEHMRPVDHQAKSDDAAGRLRACLLQEDVEWLCSLGLIEDILLDEIPGHEGKKRFSAQVIYREIEQVNFRWGTARLQLDLGDFAKMSPLTEECCTFVVRMINEVSSCEKQLSEDLVADYFDRFRTSTINDPFALYDDDVTAEQLLNDVGGVTIQIIRDGDSVAAQAWFGVPWDDEHGVELPIVLD